MRSECLVSQAVPVRTTCCERASERAVRGSRDETSRYRGADGERVDERKKKASAGEGKKVPARERASFFPRQASVGGGQSEGSAISGSSQGEGRGGAEEGSGQRWWGSWRQTGGRAPALARPREPKLRADSQGRTYTARTPLPPSAPGLESVECIPRIVISHGASTEKVMHLAREYFFFPLLLSPPVLSFSTSRAVCSRFFHLAGDRRDCFFNGAGAKR